jgi:hypothetical protein
MEGGGADVEKGVSAFCMCSDSAAHFIHKSVLTTRRQPSGQLTLFS